VVAVNARVRFRIGSKSLGDSGKRYRDTSQALSGG
jgi:hypothetical protein